MNGWMGKRLNPIFWLVCFNRGREGSFSVSLSAGLVSVVQRPVCSDLVRGGWIRNAAKKFADVGFWRRGRGLLSALALKEAVRCHHPDCWDADFVSFLFFWGVGVGGGGCWQALYCALIIKEVHVNIRRQKKHRILLKLLHHLEDFFCHFFSVEKSCC